MSELLPWVKGHYAGIGSRETPSQVLEQMKKVGSFLAQRGYVLRSGGAKGADSAFERGCDEARGMKQIWQPSQSYFPLHEWATEKASSVCWEFPLEKMKALTISLITRNMYQVYGDSEEFSKTTPVDFLVYWSEGNPLEEGADSGGTRYAVRVAHQAGIKTYNLRTQKEEFASFLRTIKEG
jgi:hypothetical protein